MRNNFCRRVKGERFEKKECRRGTMKGSLLCDHCQVDQAHDDALEEERQRKGPIWAVGNEE